MAWYVFLAFAGVVAGVLAWQFPDATERWFTWSIRNWRRIRGGMALVLAVVFLASGYWPLMLAGFVIVLYGFLWLFLNYDPLGVIGS